MKVLVSGASGLIGSRLVADLTAGGHLVLLLARPGSTPPGPCVRWDPSSGGIDVAAMEGLDAVVHLAGESIAEGRWTDAKKALIRDSRVKGTRRLSQALAELAHPPGVLACASAIGFYGDRGDDRLTETSPPGHGFLADVCREWEAASDMAKDRGVRVAQLRFGMVLTSAGGALARMLTPFRLGAGGRVGSGRQYVSWIALDDAAGAFGRVLADETLDGPINVVAPNPVTNAEFAKTLGRVLGRPTLMPVPAWVARRMFGQMADELLLSSARVEPKRLLDAGFAFRYPELEGALRHLLHEA
jgi:uncharacterized protein (TIGR01777 family)